MLMQLGNKVTRRLLPQAWLSAWPILGWSGVEPICQATLEGWLSSVVLGDQDDPVTGNKHSRRSPRALLRLSMI